MLPIELLSERFPNRFKLRWPFSNSTIEIEWIRREQILYLRPRNASLEMLWMCSIDQGNGFYESFSAVSTLATALKHKRVWRCCSFQGLDIFLNRGEGIISSPNATISHSHWLHHSSPQFRLGAAFHLPSKHFPGFQKPQKCLLAAPELIESALTKLQADESSDFCQAKRWLMAYEDEWSLIDWDSDTKLQVMALLRALYWLYDTDTGFGFPFFQLGNNNSVGMHADPYRLNAPQKLFDVINQCFQLRFIGRRRAFILKEWNKPHHSFPVLRFDPPTMHQKLEAMLLWREFMAGKLPEEEIELYLPTDLNQT